MPIILYALYLYFSSLSLRKAAKLLSLTVKRSYVAIWKWIQKYGVMLDGAFEPDKKNVNVIFVDETEINVGGTEALIWIAFDPTVKAILGS